jgi:hypothetical protein
LRPLGGGRFAADPPVAILERTTHVQELTSLRSIEAFYFLHDDACVVDGYAPESLWPERREESCFAAVSVRSSFWILRERRTRG